MKFKTTLIRLVCILLAGVVALGVFGLVRPLPTTAPTLVALAAPVPVAVSLPWPAAGQAAIGTLDSGLLASHGDQTPAPIASVAKVITALAVLKQKPLAAGQQGPTITFDSTDVSYYTYYYQNDGSVARVADGEQITEYQALQAMLLPSANNMADSLVRWAFGSMDAYVVYANQMVAAMGLRNTTVAGASGFADQTRSTATDLITLAQSALGDPVLADIVSQTQATVPEAGIISNVNWLLGSDGVIGIKTGNTDQAGGCFMFAAKRVVQGQTITVIGAVIGDTDLNQAISDGRGLIQASDSNFRTVGIKAGQTIGSYKTPWGATAKAVTVRAASLLLWNDKSATIKPVVNRVRTPAVGTNVGSVTVSSGVKTANTPVVTQSAIKKPPISWRLSHF